MPGTKYLSYQNQEVTTSDTIIAKLFNEISALNELNVIATQQVDRLRSKLHDMDYAKLDNVVDKKEDEVPEPVPNTPNILNDLTNVKRNLQDNSAQLDELIRHL